MAIGRNQNLAGISSWEVIGQSHNACPSLSFSLEVIGLCLHSQPFGFFSWEAIGQSQNRDGSEPWSPALTGGSLLSVFDLMKSWTFS